MTKAKAALLAALILFHFSIILVGIIRPKVNPNHPFWFALGWYGKITGASASYSFFSPEVPLEVLFGFTVHHKDQTQTEITLQELGNNEVNARLGNILRMIPRNFKDPKIVRSMAASLTSAVFSAYPDAETVDIHGSIYLLPTMEEYRSGRRPSLKPIYSATFARSSPK